MRIQYVSDLHLEGLQGRSDLPGVRPVDGVDVLVLAGDIVQLRRPDELQLLIEPFRARGIPVVYVPGNHEFYRLRVPMPERVRSGLEAISGLHLLDDASVVIQGVRFIGSTLWSPLRAVEEGVDMVDDEELRRYISDFRMIRCDDGERSLNPQRMRLLHRRSWDWLRAELQEAHDGPSVVVTHFVPTPLGIAAPFIGSTLNGYFVADCRPLMDQSIALWISGHTHGSFKLQDEASGLRLVCNPCGYFRKGRRENPDFDPAATVIVQ